MKKCSKCGYENDDKNVFCLNCGAKLGDVREEKSPVIQTSEKRYVKTGGIVLTSKKTTTGLAVVALIISIIAIIFSIFVSPALTLGPNSVGLNQIADNSVSSGKIVDGSIMDSDINDVGISKIADGSVNSNKILDNSILFNDLNSNTINLLTGLNAIANDSITGEKIANFTIAANDLANNSVTSQKIVDGTITESDIANDSVTYDKMNIKMKFGKAANRYNGSANGNTITHNIGHTPICVLITPDYSSFGLENATIYANVISLDSTTFTVGLWYQYIGTSGTVNPVVSGNPVDIYWIAIYTD